MASETILLSMFQAIEGNDLDLFKDLWEMNPDLHERKIHNLTALEFAVIYG
jgi:hypothetical protein